MLGLVVTDDCVGMDRMEVFEVNAVFGKTPQKCVLNPRKGTSRVIDGLPVRGAQESLARLHESRRSQGRFIRHILLVGRADESLPSDEIICESCGRVDADIPLGECTSLAAPE